MLRMRRWQYRRTYAGRPLRGIYAAAAWASRESRKSVTHCPLKRGTLGDPGVSIGKAMVNEGARWLMFENLEDLKYNMKARCR